MKLGIIGLGKLGLPLASLFSKHFKVCGVDVNEDRINEILSGRKFFEPELNQYLQTYDSNLTITTNYSILKDCNPVFIITQTPSLESGKFDIKYVESALTQLHEANPDCLAVVSSTVNIGDIDKLSEIHKQIAYNPEFIRQGTIISDFENPKFILIGAYTRKDGAIIKRIWRTIHRKPIYILKPTEAEIAKLSLNISFALGITFANIIGELCEGFNTDPQKILNLIYKDQRHYMPGLGFGGPCFPRDVTCFMNHCWNNKCLNGAVLASVIQVINNGIIEGYVKKIEGYGYKKIGVLGISYKPNVPYTYESQSLKIAEKLLAKGFDLCIFDPLAMQEAKNQLPQAHFCSSIKECLDKAEIIFVGTPNFSNVSTDKPIINPWQ